MILSEGMIVGEIIVMRKTVSTSHGWKWKCKCFCGQEFEVRIDNLTSGHTKSCGCILNKKIHGMSSSRQYRIYDAMLGRCYRSTAINYEDYGGRNITVSESWRESFVNFWNDMQVGYSDNLSLDRIDNSKGYYKENCKWSTRSEQNSNTRRNRLMEFNGKLQTLRDWSIELGINEKSLSWRVRHGWTDHEALSTPYSYRNKKRRSHVEVSA